VAQVAFKPGKGHIERLRSIIEQNRSADLIVFPELILHGHPSSERPEGLLLREGQLLYDHKKTSTDIYSFIKKTKARVIIGEIRKEGDFYYNLATYVDEKSKQSYKKSHVHWTENFLPGNSLRVFKTPIGKVGISICFDGAFPEVWRTLALRGAEIIVNISAVPKSFPVEYMWRRFSGAALNNQVYVIYANRAGSFFSGHSAVFSPKGDVLASVGEEESVINIEIDMGALKNWREEEAIYTHRRPQLYTKLIGHPRIPGSPSAVRGAKNKTAGKRKPIIGNVKASSKGRS
jgi:predicted amidohydrolase